MRARHTASSLSAFALALGVTACGSITSTTTVTVTQANRTNETTSQAQAASHTTTTTSTTSLTGPVGTPFTDTDSSGNVMGVTLVQIIDPAPGANEFATPNNGSRFVGAKFKITGQSGTFSDDANNDAVIVGSDGQSYTADFDDIAGCTNFNGGDFTVTPGASSTGCVTFQVPQNVKVASVEWGGEFGGTPATWTP